jgi:two-component system NtrC family sensor kinase
MTVTFLPIWIVDVGGAVLMIVLSFLCVWFALKLKQRDPQNIIWTYLLWVSIALAVFAVSRSVGHIVKQLLIIAGQPQTWEMLRPFSGAINSLTFVAVGAVTLFFERTWTIYQGIVRDRQALQKAHRELLYLNQNLEQLVVERTEALTRSEHKYRRIFEASKDMILTTGMDGRILDLNPAGYHMLGLDPGSLPQACLITHFLDDPQRWLEIRDDIKQKGFIASNELDLRTRKRNRLRVLLSSSLVAQNDHTIHFLVKDIEQQHLMREQMAQADKLASIGELSAGIAHEINNPLGIILGFTQLMLRQQKNNTQQREDLKTVEKHVRHCKAIVEDLLNFARTSKSKKELLDIHLIIDEVVSFIQQHSKLGTIKIEKYYDQSIGRLLIDEKKIKQVFINLMMNAVHAMRQEGVISISTAVSPKQDRALMRVQDTGMGIEQMDLPRIFDPFFTTKPTGEGTGLGLSVSYGIIKNHAGDISVESLPGQGTTFTISLPRPNQGPER